MKKMVLNFSSTKFDYFVLLILLTAYFPARFRDPSIGFENGLIESMQVFVLLLHAVFLFTAGKKEKPYRKQWYTVAYVYLLMAARELSWGRVFFKTGMTEMGPSFLPMSSLPYHNIITIIVDLVVLYTVYCLKKYVQWDKITSLKFPIVSCCLIALAVALMFVAEHFHFFGLLAAPNAQVFEEIAELCIYLELMINSALCVLKLHLSENENTLATNVL